MDITKRIIIILFIVLIVLPLYNHVSAGTLSDDAQICLGCHSSKELTKQLDNKETLSLFINGDSFAGSVHNPLGCGGCHMDISMDNHPQVKKIKSKKEYSANNSKICSMCHADEQLKTKPMHGYLVTKAKVAICSECHGAHDIKSIKEWKARLTEHQYCLTCHKYSMSMKLNSGEVLSLTVNESTLRNSVHGSLTCGTCHMEFSKTTHPFRTFKNKHDYTVKVSKACSMCHTDDQFKKIPIHTSLAAKATCIECHGFHAIKSIKAEKTLARESQYCLICHKSRISKSMKNGEVISLYVDDRILSGSVHGNLKCADCHTGFTKNVHPVRSFQSKRGYSLITSESCWRCHEKAYKQYETSVHLELLKNGNIRAPSCTDCHGDHNVRSAKKDKTIGFTSCNACHGDLRASYEASIHYTARMKGNQEAPFCSSCHNAHAIESTKMTTKIKEGCLKCHKDTEKLHNKWLSNPPIKLSSFVGAHFDVVSCAACHSPSAKRAIYLSLFDRKTGKPISQEEVSKLLETDTGNLPGKIDINSDGSIDSKELWNVFRHLYGKGISSMYKAKMDVSTSQEAHAISGKAEATKDCEKCHHPQAEFFQKVFFTIKKADGKPLTLEAKREVLNSVYTIIPVNKFYALGSTNVKLFDILFIIALIGGIAVPIGHITLRIISSPLRSLRKMGKGGKK